MYRLSELKLKQIEQDVEHLRMYQESLDSKGVKDIMEDASSSTTAYSTSRCFLRTLTDLECRLSDLISYNKGESCVLFYERKEQVNKRGGK